MPSTIRLHRVLKAPPERVYRAFLDPAAMCKWLPPYGFTCTVDRADARVGGRYHASFTNFCTGSSHAFGGEYLELVPNGRLRYSDRFDDPRLPGEMTTTVTLKAVSCGTELDIVQEGVPDAVPAEACHPGLAGIAGATGAAGGGGDSGRGVRLCRSAFEARGADDAPALRRGLLRRAVRRAMPRKHQTLTPLRGARVMRRLACNATADLSRRGSGY